MEQFAYIRNNPVAGNPVTVVQGGVGQGTWMHEDIALDFAQWLSVDFRLWCDCAKNSQTQLSCIN